MFSTSAFKPCSSSSASPALNESQTFASLLRNCKFTSIGNPVGKIVVVKIYHVVQDDLYIDFGHKFGCVCKKPRDDRGQYIRGTEVKLKVKSLEMSERFLGYNRDISLLEADCVLLGSEAGKVARIVSYRIARSNQSVGPMQGA